MKTDSFELRHIGPSKQEVDKMLTDIGVSSFDDLIAQTVPSDILLSHELNLNKAMSEQEYLSHMHTLSLQNKLFKKLYWLGISPCNNTRCRSKKYFRKPRLVHSIYSLPSRNSARTTRGTFKFPKPWLQN